MANKQGHLSFAMLKTSPWMLVPWAMLLAGCTNKQPAVMPPSNFSSPVSLVQFADITTPSGIKFTHNTGAYGTGVLPEVMGSGAAFIDYDGDGYQDIFFVNSRNWTGSEINAYNAGQGHHHAPPLPPGYLQRHSPGALYHNNGNGTFTDVTSGSGLDIAGWSTSAAWLDYDRDGQLDLFVCHYVQWSPATDTHLSPQGQMKAYVGPQPYAGEVCRLYRNLGQGRFQDVSNEAGITRSLTVETKSARKLVGKALGVAICDYNGDGWPDLVVANDMMPNFLFKNNKDGTFDEVGAATSIAYNEAGKVRAGMGVDASDVDNSGHDTVVIGNFSLEMLGFYQSHGEFFTDIAPGTALGQASLKFLTFGCAFTDYDNDGWLDLFTANGHVNPDIEKDRSGVTFAERPQLFHNVGQGQFKEVGLTCGAALAKPLLARGVACADIDLDGDEDVLFTTNGGAPLLLRNDGGNKHNAVRLILEGTRSNRSAIGATIEARVGDMILRRRVRSGSSYLSQSELPLVLGLGRKSQVTSLTIHWPSGQVSGLKQLPANRIFWINESKGITRTQAIKSPRATPGGS